MPAIGGLAQRLIGLDDDARHHLDRLMMSWSLLADLSFSDLLLLVQVEEDELRDAVAAGELEVDRPSRAPGVGPHFVVLGQMRPAGNQTLLQEDAVGRVVPSRYTVTSSFFDKPLTTLEPTPCRPPETL